MKGLYKLISILNTVAITAEDITKATTNKQKEETLKGEILETRRGY
jgi:hypothetical protein